VADNDIADLHADALAATRRIVAGIEPAQYGDPTPCADWDVRALLDHLIAGNWWAAELAAGLGVVIVCGRFEGVDERLIAARKLEEVSLGDFILSGGEIAALALLDACVRLLPGVVGRPASLHEESFAGDLLEYPHYTRPQVWEGHAVPDVLLSGHHERIREWRRRQAELATQARRPDLWARHLAAGALGPAGAPSYRADDQ